MKAILFKVWDNWQSLFETDLNINLPLRVDKWKELLIELFNIQLKNYCFCMVSIYRKLNKKEKILHKLKFAMILRGK